VFSGRERVFLHFVLKYDTTNNLLRSTDRLTLLLLLVDLLPSGGPGVPVFSPVPHDFFCVVVVALSFTLMAGCSVVLMRQGVIWQGVHAVVGSLNYSQLTDAGTQPHDTRA
jgi:hypothetical protein